MKTLLIIILILITLSATSQITYRYKRETLNAGKYVVNSIITVTPEWNQHLKTIDSLKSVIVNIKQPIVTSKNLALGKTVKVSSIENIGLEGYYAIDGDINTRWSSKFTDNQSLIVDLGAIYAIDSVVINWEVSGGKDYELFVSDDSIKYTSVRKVTDNTLLKNSTEKLIMSGRYVKMQGIKRMDDCGYSIYEFEIWGNPVNYIDPSVFDNLPINLVKLPSGETLEIIIKTKDKSLILTNK